MQNRRNGKQYLLQMRVLCSNLTISHLLHQLSTGDLLLPVSALYYSFGLVEKSFRPQLGHYNVENFVSNGRQRRRQDLHLPCVETALAAYWR